MSYIKLPSTAVQDNDTKQTICSGKLVIVHMNGQIANLQPLIISESETVNVGDKALVDYKTIVTIKDNDDLHGYTYHNDDKSLVKIIVLPEQMPDSVLMDIVEGELMHGDDVYVEVYRRGLNSDRVDADLTGGILMEVHDYYTPRLNYGKANIIKIEKLKNWQNFYDEVKPLLEKYHLNNLDSCALLKILDEAGYNPPVKSKANSGWVDVKISLPPFGELVEWIAKIEWGNDRHLIISDRLTQQEEPLEYGQSAYLLESNSDYLVIHSQYADFSELASEYCIYWRRIELPKDIKL